MLKAVMVAAVLQPIRKVYHEEVVKVSSFNLIGVPVDVSVCIGKGPNMIRVF